MIHQENVAALKAALEALIVGEQKPGWKCCCGAINKPDSEAIEVGVYPAADYQVNMPSIWSVRMTNNWSIGLSEFLPGDQIKALFEEHQPLYTP